jgi:histidinol-phosphate/aromatic aminotransferase/cobyric acid decarboxylase-like protein
MADTALIDNEIAEKRETATEDNRNDIRNRSEFASESSLAETIWPPTEKVREALEAAKQPTSRFNTFDELKLYRGLSDFCGLSGDYIQTFGGAHAALDTIGRTYLEPGTEFLVGSPISGRIAGGAGFLGVRVRHISNPMPFDANVDNLIENLSDATRLVYIGQPSFPGGAVLGESEAAYLLDNSKDAMVVIDESSLMMRQYSLTGLVKKYHNLFIIRSFGGVYGLDDESFGFVLSHPENLRTLDRYRTGRGPKTQANLAAAAVLTDLDRIDARIDEIHENMIYLIVRLRADVSACRMTASGQILLQVDNPARIVQGFHSRGIFARSLEKYGGFEKCIMVPVGGGDFGARLVEAFDALPAVLESPKSRLEPGGPLISMGLAANPESVFPGD